MANNPKNSDANDNNNVPEHQSEKAIIFTGVYGKVKWFNVKRGYGFVCRNDTQEDVFIHQSAIVKNNPDHLRKSVGEGEEIQFDIVKGVKGNEAANVCGADGNHVQGSEYALRYMRGGRGRGRGGRGRGGRGRGRSRGPSEEYDNHPNDFVIRGGFQRGGGLHRGGRNFRGGRPYMMQCRKPFPNYDMPPPPPPPIFYEYNNYDYDYFRGPARGRGGPMRGGGRIFRGGPPPREMPMNYPPYEYEFDRRPPSPPLQRGGGGRGRPRFRGRGRGWFRGRGGNRSRGNSRPEVKDEGEEHHEEENAGEHHS